LYSEKGKSFYRIIKKKTPIDFSLSLPVCVFVWFEGCTPVSNDPLMHEYYLAFEIL